MKNLNCKDLGKLFGEYSLWGDKYLPRFPSLKNQSGVLYEVLNDPKNLGYGNHIQSLSNYRKNYTEFCKAYYSNLPGSSGIRACEYTCVPYWGKEFWKAQDRIAIFADKSLNRGGASIPLYFPLCEIESWEKAFEIGCLLSRQQIERPFNWQSFMVVWMVMRFIFGKNPSYLQKVYYSDVKKIKGRPNRELLKEELKIVKPSIVIGFGKRAFDKLTPLVGEMEKTNISYIYFPTGQGTSVRFQDSVDQLKRCKSELEEWLNIA